MALPGPNITTTPDRLILNNSDLTGTSTVVAPAVGDSSTAVPSTAWVNNTFLWKIPSVKVSAIGDSIVAQCNAVDLFGATNAQIYAFLRNGVDYWSTRSFLTRAAMRSDRTYFNHTAVGMSGATSAVIRSTVLPWLLTHPKGLPSMCCVLSGLSDYPAINNIPAATTVANIVGTWTDLLANSIIPIAMSVMPLGSATSADRQWAENVNIRLMYAARQLGIPFADIYTAFLDGSTGLPKTGVQVVDGKHMTPYGAEVAGYELNSAIQRYLNTGYRTNTMVTDDATATYKTRNPMLTNALTAGTINTAGSVPGSWSTAQAAACTTWTNASETGVKAAFQVPAIGPQTAPIYQGNTLQISGNGTQVIAVQGPTITCNVGDKLGITFRVQWLPNAASPTNFGDFACGLFNPFNGHWLAGFVDSTNIGGLNYAYQIGAETVAAGQANNYAAGHFYQEYIVSSAETTPYLYIKLQSNGGNNSNSGDILKVAMPQIVNLTAIGAV